MLTNGQARFLAALLLADGRPVPYRTIADLSCRGTYSGRMSAWCYRSALRQRGIDCVEMDDAGARLTTLPPDWTLDDVLVQVRLLRQEPRLSRVTRHLLRTA